MNPFSRWEAIGPLLSIGRWPQNGRRLSSGDVFFGGISLSWGYYGIGFLLWLWPSLPVFKKESKAEALLSPFRDCPGFCVQRNLNG